LAESVAVGDLAVELDPPPAGQADELGEVERCNVILDLAPRYGGVDVRPHARTGVREECAIAAVVQPAERQLEALHLSAEHVVRAFDSKGIAVRLHPVTRLLRAETA